MVVCHGLRRFTALADTTQNYHPLQLEGSHACTELHVIRSIYSIISLVSKCMLGVHQFPADILDQVRVSNQHNTDGIS